MSEDFILKLEDFTKKYKDYRIKKVVIMYILMMLRIRKCHLLKQFVMTLKGFMTTTFSQLRNCLVEKEQEEFFENAMKLYSEIMLFNGIPISEAEKIEQYCLGQIEIKDDSIEKLLCEAFKAKSINPLVESEDKIDFFYIQAMIFKVFTDDEDFIFEISSVPDKNEIKKKIIEIYQEKGYSHAGGKKEKIFFSKINRMVIVTILTGRKRVRIIIKKF